MSPQEQPDATPDQAVRSAATQLYAGLPAEFVASRTALVKEARAAGDREAARRIGALRRPSVAAWALNQLAHQRAPVIDELADIGARLRHATSALDAAGLAELRGPRDTALAALVAAASEAANAQGQTLTATVEAEIRDTGIAALADADAEAVLRSGTLTRALSYSGFGEVDLSEAAATTSTGVVLTSIPGGRAGSASPTPDRQPDSKPDAAPTASDDGDTQEQEQARARELAAAREAAQQAVRTAEQEIGRRRAALEAARNRADATRERLAKLEQQLEQARVDDQDALEKLTDAVAAAKQAEATAAEARARLNDLGS